MSRINIDLPDSPLYETEMRVRISDVNYANHLSNDAIWGFVNEARVQFLYSRGFSEADVDGKAIILGDSAARFENQAFYGEPISLEVYADDFTEHSCSLYFHLYHADKGYTIAKAMNGLVFFDYHNQSVCDVPKAFVEACIPLEVD
ncbi:acyl-CoA thioesterase [Thaumasiovibrio subtropicus]|uniref:acyl-CoA thioesterase n=1 Tax=Thaumasiovibrio subtropicus TaxID=1891207 RepID=UPI000B34ABD6|nr:thioesterase family protein [Thaumasiovibrio subtropicus]